MGASCGSGYGTSEVGDLRPENMMCRRTLGPKALAQYTARVSATLRGYAGPYRIIETTTEPTLAPQVCAWRGKKGEQSNFLELRLGEVRIAPRVATMGP